MAENLYPQNVPLSKDLGIQGLQAIVPIALPTAGPQAQEVGGGVAEESRPRAEVPLDEPMGLAAEVPLLLTAEQRLTIKELQLQLAGYEDAYAGGVLGGGPTEEAMWRQLPEQIEEIKRKIALLESGQGN